MCQRLCPPAGIDDPNYWRAGDTPAPQQNNGISGQSGAASGPGQANTGGHQQRCRLLSHQTCLVLSASHIALYCTTIVAQHHRTCSQLHQSAFLRLRPRFCSSQPAVNTDFGEVYKTGRQKCWGCRDMQACLLDHEISNHAPHQ